MRLFLFTILTSFLLLSCSVNKNLQGEWYVSSVNNESLLDDQKFLIFNEDKSGYYSNGWYKQSDFKWDLNENNFMSLLFKQSSNDVKGNCVISKDTMVIQNTETKVVLNKWKGYYHQRGSYASEGSAEVSTLTKLLLHAPKRVSAVLAGTTRKEFITGYISKTDITIKIFNTKGTVLKEYIIQAKDQDSFFSKPFTYLEKRFESISSYRDINDKDPNNLEVSMYLSEEEHDPCIYLKKLKFKKDRNRINLTGLNFVMD